MHMADALISPAVGGTMWVLGGLAVSYSLHHVKKGLDEKQIPLMGVLGAFVFAAQMLNFTIPGTGSSGHICGGLLLASLLGPAAGFTALAVVLLIQALLFADGGLLAYGCNIINMGFYTCFLGYPLIFKPLLKHFGTKALVPAAALTSVVGLELGAFSVVVETWASGITVLPFNVFALTMLPIHLVIGLVEGLATAAILHFVWEARPDLVDAESKNAAQPTGLFVKVFAIAALLCAGIFSFFASANPDGLEWSIAKLTGSTEITNSGTVQQMAEKIQSLTALLPDYNFAGGETAWGTSIAGVVGGIIACLVCVLISKFLCKNKTKTAVKDQ
jgi:cobalt/nickel transport system permease protein